MKSIFTDVFLKKIAKIVESFGFREIVDIGCGEGYPDRYLIKKIPGVKIVGIDINQEAIKKAKNGNPQIDYRKGDIFCLAFPEKRFDLALVLEVLEHLKNPGEAIKEVERVAKKAIFSVPGEPWFSLALAISPVKAHPDHVNFWNKESFGKLVKNYFKRVEVRTVFPWLIAVCGND